MPTIPECVIRPLAPSEAAVREQILRALPDWFKTLGPSRPNEPYERTRRFYSSVGFRPLDENNLWGVLNPCLIFVRHLACTTARQKLPARTW